LGEAYGWRPVLIGVGTFGASVGILAFLAAGPTPRRERRQESSSFISTSWALLAMPAFRSLFVAAISIGFAAAPFYAFAATFLIRTHALSATQ
ncbi:hypothetical protein, partial [Staphylococcus aureus]